MRSIISSLTSATGKSWSASALLHAIAFGTLVLVATNETFQQRINFASSTAQPVTLVLRQTEPQPENETAVTVEVRPKVARIEERRFVHTLNDHSKKRVVLPDNINLSDSNLARNSAEHPAPLADHPLTSVPRKILHRTPKQLNSLVSTLPMAKTSLPIFGSNRPPSYPQAAIERGAEGTVILRVHLSAEGTVRKVEVLESSGFQVLDGSAVNAVKNWTATPAKQNGEAVATVIRLPVKFRLPK